MGANIPLPALQAGNYQQLDLGKIYAQALQEKAARQEMAIRAQQAPLQQQAMQQQVQAGQQENQIRAQQLKDQQAMTAAMQQWDGKDYNGLTGLMVKNGASANAVMGLKKMAIEQQQSLASLTTAQLAAEKQKNDFLAQLVDNVKSLPPEQQAQGFEQAKATAIQHGYLKPEEAQGMQYQGPEQLDLLEKSLLGHAGAIESVAKQASIAKTQAETTKLQQETQFGPTGPAREAKYQYILGKIRAGTASPEEKAYAQSYEDSESKNTTQSDSLGVVSNSAARPAGVANASRGSRIPVAGPSQGGGAPSQGASNVKESLIEQIGQYKMDPALMGRALYRHPELLGILAQKYPGWDQTKYQAKAAIVKSMAAGNDGKQLDAINTAMGHLGALDEAVQALNNGDVKMLNSIGNRFGVNVAGLTPAAAFKTIVHRVGPEVTAAYIPGAGGEHERIANQEDFSENLAPQILHNNIAESIRLLRSKVGSMENRWNNFGSKDDFESTFLTPEARAAFQRVAGQGGGGGGNGGFSVTAPNGKTYHFDSQDKLDDFKKAAGIQ